MTPNEYQKLAMRTCNIPYDNKIEMLHHALFGLTSEAGEAAGIMQKVYQGHPDPRNDENERVHLLIELGDCLWMIAEAIEALGFNMETAMLMNIQKLKTRYPNGFEAEKSLHRAKGDI